MIAASEDDLICDLAETYGILHYRALPASLLAALASGLRDGSRIKMRIRGDSVSQDTLLLAAAVDRLSFLVWAKTEDGQKGRNRPTSLVDLVTGKMKANNNLTFDTAEEFETAWESIVGVKHGNGIS